MDVRNSLDGLRSLLGVNQAQPAATQNKGNAATAAGNGWDGDQATVSSAANEMAQAVSSGGVRMDKVAAVQSALAAGTYNVSAAAVASSIMTAMLSGGR